jgi:hypothetical protein
MGGVPSRVHDGLHDAQPRTIPLARCRGVPVSILPVSACCCTVFAMAGFLACVSQVDSTDRLSALLA